MRVNNVILAGLIILQIGITCSAYYFGHEKGRLEQPQGMDSRCEECFQDGWSQGLARGGNAVKNRIYQGYIPDTLTMQQWRAEDWRNYVTSKAEDYDAVR